MLYTYAGFIFSFNQIHIKLNRNFNYFLYQCQKECLLKNKINEEEKTAKVLNEKINLVDKEIKMFSKYESKVMQKLFSGEDKKSADSSIKSPAKKILFKEIFTGLHVTKRENLACSLFDSPSYEISIQCLPDDYLDPEKKSSLETGIDEASPVKCSVTDSAINVTLIYD